MDYILALVAKYHETNCKDRNILTSIDRAVDASIELRSKKELIHDFINVYSDYSNNEIHDAWHKFIDTERKNELEQIIMDNNLQPHETRRLIENSFHDGILKTTGTDMDRIMPVMSRFGKNNDRAEKKQNIIARLAKFFEKYFGAI